MKMGLTTEPRQMHYRHSNSEVSTTYTKTGKTIIYKECDICGAQQHSNYGFTVSYDMPNACGKERHGYCAKCANKLIPILLNALHEIGKKQQEMRETAPRGKTYVDSKTAWGEAIAEAYPEIAEAYAKAAKEEL